MDNTPPAAPQDEGLYSDLARRIYAAVISYKLGIGLDYALRTYVKGPPGKVWEEVAEYVHTIAMDERSAKRDQAIRPNAPKE